MKNFNKLLKKLNFSLLLLLSGIFTACSVDSVEMFGDFTDDLIADTSSLYRFYYSNEEDSGYVSKYYRIGANLSVSDFPYQAATVLRVGYRVTEFKFLREAESLETEIPETITLDENGSISSLIVDTHPYDFYCEWAANTDTKYTVHHFKQNLTLDGYEEDQTLIQTLSGTTDTLTEASALDISGFTALSFDQVNIDGDGSAEVNIYYDRISVTLTVDYADGTTATTYSGYYGQEVELEIPDRSSEGYEFSYWAIVYADGSSEVSSAEKFTYPAQNTSITAVWSEVTYTITWIIQTDETMTITPVWISGYTAQSTYTVSTGYTLPDEDTMDCTGYEFDAWYTDSTCLTQASDWTSGDVGDKVFYAKWALVYYHINYELNDGSYSGDNPTSYSIEDTVVLPTSSEVSRSGYTFAGWYTDANFTDSAVTGWESGLYTGEFTFYAKWTTESTVTPTYPTQDDAELEITTATYEETSGLVYEATYTSTSGESLSYQWYLDGEVMTGATTLSGTYTVSLTAGYHSLVIVVTDGSDQYSVEKEFQVTN